MATYSIHKAETRGHADHGWLDTHHTFSFSSYSNSERMHFGAIRVLNDDIVTGGKGFGMHRHENMEIISIPISGALEHKDSTGRHKIIRTNDVQIMSAGSGISHSEYNASTNEIVNFLQIWVYPKIKDISPRYEQKTFTDDDKENIFRTIVSPQEQDGGVWINQDAWFSLSNLKKGFVGDYRIRKNGNGVYAFVIKGMVTIDGNELSERDGLGIAGSDVISIATADDATLLLMDIPMEWN